MIIFLIRHELIDAKCNISVSMAVCDSLDVPPQVHQSVDSLTIRNGFNGPSLPQYIFQSSKVKRISINDCKIKNIRENTFVDLLAVYISLRDNKIEAILPGAFKKLTQLERLSLTHNNLKVVQAGVFTNLPIADLTLSHNLIDTIEDVAFVNLPNLKKLRLDSNRIENFFISKIIDDPSRLEILWLHNNFLKALTNYMLQGLINLTLLNVGFNKIETIEEGTFGQTPKLQTLVLTNNVIKELDGSVFPREGLRTLENIYLDNNVLMYLPSSFFFRLNFLKKVTLVGNPWLCPCLDVISRILYDNGIKEKCRNEYGSGGKPVCVSEPSEKICSFKYNNDLSVKYLQAKNSNVGKGRLPICFL